MKALHMTAWVLVIIGGLNWLITGFDMNWNLGSFLGMTIARIIYILVGLSAVYELFTHKSNCKMCGSSSMPMNKPAM